MKTLETNFAPGWAERRNLSDITICRNCRAPIFDGELVLEPDFAFETGLHSVCPEPDKRTWDDDEETAAFDLAIEQEIGR